jgi:peptide/nickel transport system substrate-binding protein
MDFSRKLVVLVAACSVLAACAPGPGTASPGGGGSGSQPRTTPKRIVAGIQDDIPIVYQKLNPSSRYRGVEAVQDMVSAGLTLQNPQGQRMPELAEEVPSIENGLWKVAPDGTMQVTWHIKPSAVWHDGVPFTSDDLVFTLQVVRDKELAIFSNQPYDYITGIQAPDARTVTVSWSQPYIHADALFSNSLELALPFAKHKLEQSYQGDKANFINDPAWGRDWIGTGPFKIKDWELGSHLTVSAFDQFVLGRPKADEIEVRFITDDETMAANLLAESIYVVVGRGLTGPQAFQIENNWGGKGHIEVRRESWIALYPQFIDPNPAVMLNLPFRQAILYGTNRQEMVDVLLPGLSSVADSWILPGQPQYKEIEDQNVTHFAFDPRRAQQMIEGLGYARASDGLYADSAGKQLSIEVRTTAGDDLREKMLLTIIDDWKQMGLMGEPVLIPRQRAQDLAYRATFPGFELNRNPPDERGNRNLQFRTIPLAENNFQVSGNRSRYGNAELDALVDRYFTTIPIPERMQIMGQIARHMSQNLPVLGVMYDAAPTLINNRLANVGGGGSDVNQAWNSFQWDLK